MKIQITRKEYNSLINYFYDLKDNPCIGCENNARKNGANNG